MYTELNFLFVLAMKVIWVTTMWYDVGHYFESQEKTYFIVKGYFKKGRIQKILICMLASVLIVAAIYIIVDLCMLVLVMNGIQ